MNYNPFGVNPFTKETLEELTKKIEIIPPAPKYIKVNEQWFNRQIENGKILRKKEEDKLSVLMGGIPVKIDDSVETWKLEY